MKCEDCGDHLGGLARVVGRVKRHDGKVTHKAGIYCNKCADIRLGDRDTNGRLVRT